MPTNKEDIKQKHMLLNIHVIFLSYITFQFSKNSIELPNCICLFSHIIHFGSTNISYSIYGALEMDENVGKDN